MAITCPACNKTNQTETLCARCGCDLGKLHTVVQTAAATLAQGYRNLRATEWQSALDEAERSWGLCHSVEAARLAFLAASALGYTRHAMKWHARANAQA